MLAAWNWIRILRLVLGAAGLIQGISTHNNALTAIGVLLLIQSVFHMGCCGTSCTPVARNNQSVQKPLEEIRFEEVK